MNKFEVIRLVDMKKFEGTTIISDIKVKKEKENWSSIWLMKLGELSANEWALTLVSVTIAEMRWGVLQTWERDVRGSVTYKTNPLLLFTWFATNFEVVKKWFLLPETTIFSHLAVYHQQWGSHFSIFKVNTSADQTSQ